MSGRSPDGERYVLTSVEAVRNIISAVSHPASDLSVAGSVIGSLISQHVGFGQPRQRRRGCRSGPTPVANPSRAGHSQAKRTSSATDFRD